MALTNSFAGLRGLRGYSSLDPITGFLGADAAPSDAKVVVRPAPNATPGWPGFLGWMAAKHPQLYNYVRVSAPDFVQEQESARSGAVMTLGDDTPAATPGSTPSMADNVVDIIKQAAGALIPLYTQKQLLDINLKRAQQGLPPVDSDFGAVRVGMSQDTKNLLIYGGVGVALLYLGSKMLSGRRR